MDNPVQLLARLDTDPRVAKLKSIFPPHSSLALIGGTVRDALLGRAHEDLDFASALTPHETMTLLAQHGVRTIPTGLKHQTITVLPIDGLPHVEITTFRGPNLQAAGGQSFSKTIEEDVQFRDFTLNALAYLVSERKFVDKVGGLEDITTGTIRAVGHAGDRFAEDPLRVLRMVRFACVFSFRIEGKTFAAAPKFAPQLEHVSVERIREEYNKILISEKPDWGTLTLIELGAFAHIIPEVLSFVNFEQNSFHTADLLTHTLEVVRKTSPDLILRLAALLHDVGKPQTLSIDEETQERHFYLHEVTGAEMSERILRRLRYSNEIIDAVVTLVRTHMRPLESGPGGLRRLLRDTGEHYQLWRELKEADASSCKLDPATLEQRLTDFDRQMAEVKLGPKLSPLSSLAIKGTDLLALGMAEGPRIGEILRALHERVLDQPELNERETLLKLASELGDPSA